MFLKNSNAAAVSAVIDQIQHSPDVPLFNNQTHFVLKEPTLDIVAPAMEDTKSCDWTAAVEPTPGCFLACCNTVLIIFTDPPETNAGLRNSGGFERLFV